MSANLDPCFQYIFGLSETECECPEFADGKPEDFNVSDSGIFLDQLEGLSLNLILSGTDCNKGSLWLMADAARAEAVRQTKNDLLSCMVSRTRIKRQPFSGVIGDYMKFSKDHVDNNTYAGLRLRIADIVGGFAKLRRIGMLFNTTGVKTVTIYDYSGEIVATYVDVPTIANKISWFTLPEVLELSTDSPTKNFVDYNFIYTVDANRPKDMKIACDCGGYKPLWNEGNPTYLQGVDKGNFGWANFAMATGIKGNDLTDQPDWTREWYTNGIALDIQFGCKTELTICNGELDYQNHPYALALAYTARYKAGEILIKNIMAMSNPNYYINVAPEMMVKMMSDYSAAYWERIRNYLCLELTKPENLNMNADCLTCRNENGMAIHKLLKADVPGFTY